MTLQQIRFRFRCLHRPSFRIIALIGLVLAAAPGVRTGEPPVYALTNARLIPVSTAPIEKGTILIRGAIIEALGESVSLPGDARIIDAAGMTIYPGLIDSLSDATLEEPRPPAGTTPGARPGVPAQQSPAATPEERQPLTPHVSAADIINLANRKIEASRASGIAIALVAPRRGLFPGQSALINLSGIRAGQMVVKSPVAMHIGLQTSGGFGGSYPSSLMGVLAFVKQKLLDAQHYERAWGIYNANRGAERPEYDRALEALQPALKRQMAVVLPGDTPAQIERAINLADSFKLQMILNGGLEAATAAALLKKNKVPVLLSVKFPERDREADPAAEEELQVLRRRVAAPGTAAALARAGVQFAFQSGDMTNPRDFMRNISRSIEHGLDKDIALRALTLTPAEIFGVSDRFGSLEKGKTANLVVATGDLFDSRTRVKHVFIDGAKFDIPEPESSRAREAPPSDANNLSGVWTLKIHAPQGPIEATLRITQRGNTLSGTMTTHIGAGELSNGVVSGNAISFMVLINSSARESLTFSGTVQGDSMRGIADTGFSGKMDFTGARSPGAEKPGLEAL
jgi:imidazolonepropionase-like amidohydrolase